MKKQVIRLKLTAFRRNFQGFVSSKVDFVLKQDSSTKSIEWGDKIIQFRNFEVEKDRANRSEGFHLTKLVKKDVLKFIEDNPSQVDGQEPLTSDIYLEIAKGNIEALKKNEGKIIYSVDINDCYWDTAFKMGFISSLTYYKGLQKKDWKTGRNAAIGSLGKNLVVSKYENGQLVSSEVDLEGQKLSMVREKVISHVHEAFLALLKRLDTDWLMYFTDCVYVPYNRITEVQEYFKELGYQSKVEAYNLDKVNEETGMVEWFDFKMNATPLELRKKNWVVNKNYFFSKRQRTLEIGGILAELKDSKLQDNTDFLKQ